MLPLPEWLDELRRRREHEGAGEHLARMVRTVAPCSLVLRRDRLEALFLANEATEAKAKLVATFKTNCGTSMRQFLCLAGCEHELVTKPYQVGMAVAWLVTAARDLGAIVPASEWRKAGPGWGLHYGTKGRNDDHVEWCLAVPDARGYAEHGGGGRAQNAITVQPASDIRWSSGRPLIRMFDPAKMVTNPVMGDNPYV